MTAAGSSETLALPLSSIVSLAIEHWRLSGCVADIASDSAGPARHALRRIGDVLAQCQVEAIELDGKPFDAGMAAEVIDRIEDDSLARGESIVDETISPLVLWRGQVVKGAQVVIRVSPHS